MITGTAPADGIAASPRVLTSRRAAQTVGPPVSQACPRSLPAALRASPEPGTGAVSTGDREPCQQSAVHPITDQARSLTWPIRVRRNLAYISCRMAGCRRGPPEHVVGVGAQAPHVVAAADAHALARGLLYQPGDLGGDRRPAGAGIISGRVQARPARHREPRPDGVPDQLVQVRARDPMTQLPAPTAVAHLVRSAVRAVRSSASRAYRGSLALGRRVTCTRHRSGPSSR
jgi:hypothetical protein